MKERASTILADEFPMSKIYITNVGEDGCIYFRDSHYQTENKRGCCRVAGIISFRISPYEITETVLRRYEE